jgi:hypothetical protein
MRYVIGPDLNDPAGVARALTRDTARLTGRPAAAGATMGELLLWFAESPTDRRPPTDRQCSSRRSPRRILRPLLDVRRRTGSPRARILRVLRTLGSGVGDRCVGRDPRRRPQDLVPTDPALPIQAGALVGLLSDGATSQALLKASKEDCRQLTY